MVTTTDSPAAETATELLAQLSVGAAARFGSASTVTGLVRLSGGASRETWAFDVATGDGTIIPLILKRDPVVFAADGSLELENSLNPQVSRKTEGQLFELARAAGVPSPEVHFYLQADARNTGGVVMQRLAGEALGRRIVRDEAYAAARPKLAWQCGHAAARIHHIAPALLPPLASMTAADELNRYHGLLQASEHPYPTLEYAFHWLAERLELAGTQHCLVHGDFRNGNILVDATGLQAVLDWELAHTGNPVMDLGWMCLRSWRYGVNSKHVGGFGQLDELLAGYEAGGGVRVSAESIHYWEVFGGVRWGILCVQMAFGHLQGSQHSLEHAAIGRRTAEVEYDLLLLLD